MSTPSIKNRILEEKFNMAKSKQKTLAAASLSLQEIEPLTQNQLKAFDHTEVAEIMNELAGSPDDISKYQLLKGVANQINEAMSAPGALGLTINIPDIDEKYLNV